MINKTKSFILLFFSLILCFCALSALQAQPFTIYPGLLPARVSEGYVLLDPDNWSKKQLFELKEKGVVSLAWLNLSDIEPKRIVPINIKKRDYVFPRDKTNSGNPLAIFYSTYYRKMLADRLREYLLKGFDGVVLARAHNYDEISDHPINRKEMWSLIMLLAFEAQKINPNSLIIVHDNGRFVEKISNHPFIAGSLVEGLFNEYKGRHIYPWEREKRLKILEPLLTNKKLIFTVETSDTEERKNQVLTESKTLNLFPAFSMLPLTKVFYE